VEGMGGCWSLRREVQGWKKENREDFGFQKRNPDSVYFNYFLSYPGEPFLESTVKIVLLMTCQVNIS